MIKMINWKVRLKNKIFWLSIVPACIVMIQSVASVFGYTLDLGEIGNKMIDIVNAAFLILSLLGIVNDPTTTGITDSNRALTYNEPNPEKGRLW